MGKLCKLLDGRIMHVWSINEEDETVDVFPDSDYDIEVDVPETIKDHLVLCIDSSETVLNSVNPTSLNDYRTDLVFQIGAIDDLDWDYFLETTEKAKASAIREGLAFNQIDGAAFNIETANDVYAYRKQIKHELDKPIELDWNRFEGLVIEARNVAISNDENMTFDRAACKILYREKTMKDYDSVTVRDCDDKFAKEMFLDLRAELGDEEAMRQAVASYQIPNWIQASILESCRVQDFIGLDDSGNIYFVVYLENKTVITVIDLSPSARHERDQWETVNDEDFYDRNNAVDYARKLAEKYNLGYKPFDSRYDKSLNEQSNNHLSL